MAERDPILTELFSRRGMTRDVAAACGISAAAVSQWLRVPAERVREVAKATGIPAKKLRPDLHQVSTRTEAA